MPTPRASTSSSPTLGDMAAAIKLELAVERFVMEVRGDKAGQLWLFVQEKPNSMRPHRSMAHPES